MGDMPVYRLKTTMMALSSPAAKKMEPRQTRYGSS